MTECYSCGLEFEVKFEDSDAELNFCPSCGSGIIDPDKEETQLEMNLGGDE
ncbi:MAG: hypothetical protein ACKVJK_11115 [Methylophagaceae bacterium]|jgi:hypothetical protein|tara:strand:- start:145 stop:297 length:153 start_codon:yes stop_codon:yes gene_type:complete